MQLKDGSEFLEGQKEDMIHIWEGLKQRITMASFYEIPSGREVNNGCSDNIILLKCC
jgi:hypothetical protein